MLYLAFDLRLVPLLPRSKTPYRAAEPDAVTGWRMVVIGDANPAERFVQRHPHSNWAVIWRGVQVDLDNGQAVTWAKERGVTAEGAWVLQTGKGWRVLFAAPENCPMTFTGAQRGLPDLLGPGRLAVVPPSVHANGHSYAWAQGHSPGDIGLDGLAALPQRLVEDWRELAGLVPHRPRTGLGQAEAGRLSGAPRWLSLVYRAICDELERRGHRLRRCGDGFTTTCPFHDDHNPSLSLHPERGWKCWAGCGEGRLTLLAARLGVRA